MGLASNGLNEMGIAKGEWRKWVKGMESALWVLFAPLRRPYGRRSGLCNGGVEVNGLGSHHNRGGGTASQHGQEQNAT